MKLVTLNIKSCQEVFFRDSKFLFVLFSAILGYAQQHNDFQPSQSKMLTDSSFIAQNINPEENDPIDSVTNCVTIFVNQGTQIMGLENIQPDIEVVYFESSNDLYTPNEKKSTVFKDRENQNLEVVPKLNKQETGTINDKKKERDFLLIASLPSKKLLSFYNSGNDLVLPVNPTLKVQKTENGLMAYLFAFTFSKTISKKFSNLIVQNIFYSSHQHRGPPRITI